MNCLQAEKHFSAHLEDEIDYRTLRSLEAHLETCGDCQREYVLFAQTITEVEELPQVEPSPHFMAALTQRLAEEPRDVVPFWQRIVYGFTLPRWAYGALLLVFATTAAYLVYEADVFERHQSRALTTATQTQQSPAERTTLSKQGRTRGPALSTGAIGTSISDSAGAQPMQHYVLKQVSYTNIPTQGGL